MAIAPSTYYAAKARPPSARKLRDDAIKAKIIKLHQQNPSYGVRRMWLALRRDAETVGRDRVARLMRELGIRGIPG